MYHSLFSIPLSLTSNMTIYGNILSDAIGYLKSCLTFTNSTDFLCKLLTTSVPEKSVAYMSTGKACTALAYVCLLASLLSFCSSQSSIASENFARRKDSQITFLVRGKMVIGNALLEMNCATIAPSVRMNWMRECPKSAWTVGLLEVFLMFMYKFLYYITLSVIHLIGQKQ